VNNYEFCFSDKLRYQTEFNHRYLSSDGRTGDLERRTVIDGRGSS